MIRLEPTLLGGWVASDSGVRFQAAVRAWLQTGNAQRLGSWFARELDSEGRPRGAPAATVWELLRGMDAGLPAATPRLPEEVRTPLGRLLRFALGQAGEDLRPGASQEPAAAVLRLARCAENSGLERLARLLRATRPGRLASAPREVRELADFVHPGLPIAALRAEWRAPATVLTIDHARRAADTAVRLRIDDREWLGPHWSIETDAPHAPSAARWRERSIGPVADLLEWSLRIGPMRVTRTALLLKQRNLVLLADQIDGVPSAAVTTRLDLHGLVRNEPSAGTRGLQLIHTGRSRLCVWPLALPCLPYATDRGRLEFDGRRIGLVQDASAPRLWMPLLLSWDPARNRKAVEWRVLTVSESYRKCRPGAAFAVRVGFKGEPSLVIYRSLARPARRAFLGHQTTARFLVGDFEPNGTVTPLIEIA